MSKNSINVAEILKDAPRGIELYSPICGTVLLCSIDDDSIEVSVKNYPSSEPHKFLFDIHGVSYGEYGECLLFPSKENRNWQTFKAPWKHQYFEPGQKILVPYCDGTIYKWRLTFYSHYDESSKHHMTTDAMCFPDEEVITYKSNEDKLGKPVE